MKINSQLRKYNLNASHKLVGIKKDTNEQGGTTYNGGGG